MATKKAVETTSEKLDNAMKMAFYRTYSRNDIIEYCKAHGQIDWLKAEAKKEVMHKVYPKKMGVNKKGKPALVADKSQAPTFAKERITFVELKYNFFQKFMPEKLPVASKEKAPTFYDLIEAL